MSRKPVKGYKALQLWIILLTPLLVVVSATLLFYTGWLNPDTTTNNGTLIDPPIDITELGVEKADRQWWLVTAVDERCGTACEEQLFWVGQVISALGKDAPRVSQKLIYPAGGQVPTLPESENDVAEMAADLAPLPVKNPVQLFVVDPNGNVIMTFGPENAYEEVLEDMEELLTLSTIG